MKFRSIFKSGMLSILLTLAACANPSIEKEVNDKISQESEIKTRADLTADTKSSIENAKGVTLEQKSQLLSLRESTNQQIESNWQESLKLKSILIQDLVANEYNEREVELLKGKLQKLETKRLSIMFSAVDRASKILGHQARLNKDIMLNLSHTRNF